MTEDYDVLVVGSGTAGQTAAYQLNKDGLKVGLVEHSDRPGGTCALSGCQAKKWFYEGTEVVARSHHLAQMGIDSPASGSWAQLLVEKNKFTTGVPDNTISGLKDAGIDFIKGRARFVDQRAISVSDRRLTARYIVLATGAVPMVLPFDGGELMVTSREFMELAQLPRRIVYIGGGFISFEFAHFAARLGGDGTRCTILEAAARPLANFDEEMVDLLVAASASEGIDLRCEVNITAITKTGRTFKVITESGPDFEADLVVHGAGRSPDIESLALEKAGIDSSRQGIRVNTDMATTNPWVYAVGDCAATVQLARVADAEAQVAAANIVIKEKGGQQDAVMDYTAVPSVLFTYPQYGMEGATESELDDKGVAFKKSFAKELAWPTYKRVGLTSAAYNLLVAENGRILGAHVLSDNATGLINAFMLAMVNRLSVETLYRQSVMTPYPSRESDIIYMLKPLID
ncbi:MAG: NAD(P)/FAD-dependent oxidoreductase [Desulfobacterales bacterium]|nr:NAD(P)/FAD-dependent oxidoreductase [Desulfobacterales bacterium]